MNQATFIGNLTADAVQRTAQNGTPCATFTVAVNRRHGDTQETLFVQCTKAGNTERLFPYLRKGTRLAVTGRVTPRAWIGKDGAPRAGLDLFCLDLELLGGGADRTAPAQGTQTQTAYPQGQPQTAYPQPAQPVQQSTYPQQPAATAQQPASVPDGLPF